MRWAIIEANNSSVPDTIAFSSLFDTPQTILLTQGPLTLECAATTTIAGPGATLLTINAGGASRVFEVQGGQAALSGLTVTDGTADVGGGLYNSAGTRSRPTAPSPATPLRQRGRALDQAAGNQPASLQFITP